MKSAATSRSSCRAALLPKGSCEVLGTHTPVRISGSLPTSRLCFLSERKLGKASAVFACLARCSWYAKALFLPSPSMLHSSSQATTTTSAERSRATESALRSATLSTISHFRSAVNSLSSWRHTGLTAWMGATTSVAPECVRSCLSAFVRAARASLAVEAMRAMALTVLPAPTASAITPPRSGWVRVALTLRAQPTPLESVWSEYSTSSKVTFPLSTSSIHVSALACRGKSALPGLKKGSDPDAAAQPAELGMAKLVSALNGAI